MKGLSCSKPKSKCGKPECAVEIFLDCSTLFQSVYSSFFRTVTVTTTQVASFRREVGSHQVCPRRTLPCQTEPEFLSGFVRASYLSRSDRSLEGSHDLSLFRARIFSQCQCLTYYARCMAVFADVFESERLNRSWMNVSCGFHSNSCICTTRA